MPSEMELERAAAMQRNKLMMEQLGIGEGAESMASAAPVKPVKPKKAPVKRAPKVKEEPQPRRSSSRVAGLILDDSELKRKREDEAIEDAAAALIVKKARHAPRSLVTVNTVKKSGTTESLQRCLLELAQECKATLGNIKHADPEVKPEEVDVKPFKSPSKSPKKTPKKAPLSNRKSPRAQASTSAVAMDDDEERKPSASIEELKESLAGLVLRSLVKVVPERVYSLVVHPSVTKELVFVGDKTGFIGLWDATHAGEIVSGKDKIIKGEGGADEEEGEEDGAVRGGTTWNWQAHGKNSITMLKLHPVDHSSILSSSYDCTVRSMNFETGQSTEVLDTETFGSESILGSFDITQDGNSIWASDNEGGITHRDLREKISSSRRWVIDAGKVGGISLNPQNPNIAITAHLKREMKIHDLRKIQAITGDDSIAAAAESQLFGYTHGKAVSSAYFDTSGTKILSTCYDDNLRVWSDFDASSSTPIVGEYEPLSIAHNNQVGRYVSVFKAQWAATPGLPAHLTVGGMGTRAIDVFSGETGEHLAGLYDAEQVTAVPAATGCHPLLGDRYYGATAAGKVSFFSKPLGDVKEE